MQLLDPAALVEQLQRVVPTQGASDQTGSSSGSAAASGSGVALRDRNDALAALVHTILTRLGFRLTSLTDDPQRSTITQYPDNVLPAEWNASGPGSYTFRYAHEQSSLTFLTKIVSLGARVLIHATALESNKTESYEVELERFTSRNYWPWPRATSSSSQQQAEPLVNGFVSSSRIADFVFGFQVKIVQKLVPGLRKDGYEEVSETEQGSSSSSSRPTQNPRTQRDPSPVRPWQPEDPDDVYPHPAPRNPLNIGDRDLDPFGGGGGIGGIGGGGAFRPPPIFGGGPDNGGGMIVGPNHPMFRDRFQDPSRAGGLGGGMVPPGARFDPVTPFGGIPQPGRPFGNGPRGPRRPGMGDPDWDEMPPPGNNSNYDDMFM